MVRSAFKSAQGLKRSDGIGEYEHTFLRLRGPGRVFPGQVYPGRAFLRDGIV